jgi:D-aspartate ligase
VDFRSRNVKDARNFETRTKVIVMPVLPGLDTKYPALILKADRSPLNHGALGIARSLGRLGVPVYAVVEEAYAPLATSRYITKALVSKRWPADRNEFLSAMSAISGVIGHPTILIPMDDLSAISVAENQGTLNRWFLLPQLPQNLPRQLANKASFSSLCAGIGVPCARSIVPRSAEDVREFIEQNPLPILVKATEQWRPLNDRYSIMLMHNREALFEIYDRTKSEERSMMILQQYIPGEDWLYNGYCNCEMDLYLGFTGRKLMKYPVDTGSSALGISLHNEVLRSQAERFLRAISYSGICDLDWRRDSRDGQYKIVDFNPRIGLNFEMFENNHAIDVVRAQHLNLTGRKVDCGPTLEGRLFTAEPLYLRTVLRGGCRSTLTTEALTHYPLTVTRKLAWWSGDDPFPFLAMCMRLMLGAIIRRSLPVIKFIFRCSRLWAPSGMDGLSSASQRPDRGMASAPLGRPNDT